MRDIFRLPSEWVVLHTDRDFSQSTKVMRKPPAAPRRGFTPLTITADVFNSLHLYSKDTRLHGNVFCYLAMFYFSNGGEN